jgi:transient receptor potential cation channel subfamily V member 5
LEWKISNLKLFQTLFVLFMAIVGVLLINMLIAMMGNTYTKIAETKNEWQRQWARIVLVVERGVPPHDRLKNFNHYSKLMVDGRPALILRLNMTVRLFLLLVKKHENIFFCKNFIGR